MKIMKYILLTFALFYLNVSIWGQEKSIGITLEDVAGMKEKEKEQEKAMRTPRNTFIVNLGYGWITSRVEMRSGTYKWKGGPEYKVAYNWVGKKGYGFGLECAAFSGIAAELSWGVEYMLNRVIGLGLGVEWWRASLTRPDDFSSAVIVIDSERHGVNRFL